MRTEPSKTPAPRPRPAAPIRRKVALAPGEVSISPTGLHGILVKPDLVPISPPGRTGPHKVTWRIASNTVPVGGRLEIDFKTHNGTKGPFMAVSPNGQGRGHYRIRKQVSMVIVSGQVDQKKNPKPPGFWKYKVEVFNPFGIRERWVDPGVAIDEGGGGGGG